MFDGKPFVQHNGVAMGAPLAPVIADIFMADLEISLMDRLEQAGVCEWHRYVDDTFVLLEPGTDIKDVLDILNGFHPSVQFTHQPEADDSLPFLDVRVIRSLSKKKEEQNKKEEEEEEEQEPTFIFDTTIYRKETFTGLMTNWHSFVPFSYKKASVVSMIQRALSVCSTYDLLDVELWEIRRICQENGYPAGFVDTRIGIGLTKYLNKDTVEPKPPVAGCEKRRMFVEIPFIGKQTDLMKKKIDRLAAKVRPDLDIRFFAKPPRSVQTYFPTKDPVPKHLQTGVVYSVSCKDCGDTYVGKTIRQCGRRICEHGAPKDTFDQQPITDDDNDDTATEEQQLSPKTRRKTIKVKPKQQQLRRSSRIRNRTTAVVNASANNKTARKGDHVTSRKINDDDNTKKNPSALAEHEKNTGHQIDWKNSRVVWRDNVAYRLLIKESMVIKAYEPRLNRTTHSVPMMVFPEGLARHLVPDPNG